MDRWYKIEDVSQMEPFFISLASESDLWMYIGSTGGLTCGRVSPDQALFPYYTDDKVIENYVHTGPQTCINGWHPFRGEPGTVTSLAKNVTGNKLLFTERNEALGLEFSYLWTSSDKWGWIRKATLKNVTGKPIQINLSDRLTNILPAGVNRQTQNVFSTLVDGYKRTEHVPDTTLVLFRMEAIMVDRAEPSESLRCNTGWVAGWEPKDIVPAEDLLGVRGEMGVDVSWTLKDTKSWYFVLDVEKDVVAVKSLLRAIKNKDIECCLEQSIEESTKTLYDIVAANDGIQETGDEALDARHFANVLFNTMRGGYFCDGETIHKDAFLRHVQHFNKQVYKDSEDFLRSLPDTFTLAEFTSQLSALHRAPCTMHQLKRLCLNYLPLTFSRRHGDPSRPWNSFDIRVKDEQGNRLLAWQGNWRDIFQNWEALCTSYPYYTNSVIATFLNASTADGYNPYRITSEGIDWEVIEKDNPWSNIGYWGDHQIIYLCKLIELSLRHDAKALRQMEDEQIFSFANVPYRIKSDAEVKADPKHSIVFDDELHKRIMALIPTYGEDARLILDDSSAQPVLATLTDKLLITLLTKMSNLIPNVGIWMNTLRPEWNDANNALVGNGASVVTLCYMHRFVGVMEELYGGGEDDLTIYKDVYTFLKERKGEQYRNAVYAGLSKERVTIPRQELLASLREIKQTLRTSIEANRREDGLWHTYNIINGEHLYLMLEGQVAVLSSNVLNGEQTLAVLKALRQSELYCPRRHSYMLYPQRRLPSFLDKNTLPLYPSTPLLLQCGALCSDADGELHWNADFRNAAVLRTYLEKQGVAETDIQQAEELYEQTFRHRLFTGRSGTFYKYEGLGSIYWHMVSKLLLAVAENIVRFEQEDPSVVPALVAHFRDIREGIGAHKSAKEYGAFPFDPYSHTPFFAGAQQPGMTGQVKEDILSRFIELGIREKDGEITLSKTMLQPSDFKDNQLSFTFRGKPYVIHK